MKTDKRLVDKLFEQRLHISGRFKAIDIQIGIAAEEYIHKILKEEYNKTGETYMSYTELLNRLRIEESRFTQDNIDEGLYRLNWSRKATYVPLEGSFLKGMRLIEIEEEK